MRLSLLVLALVGCSEFAVVPNAPVDVPEPVDEPDGGVDSEIPEDVPLGGVEGTICIAEAVGLAGAEVALEHRYGVARTATDEEGSFALHDLPAGDYVLVVTAPDYSAQIPVSIPPNEVTQIESEVCIDECDIPVPCVGLAEAVDRHAAVIRLGGGGVIEVENVSEEVEICLTEWAVVISDTSQDAAIGQNPYVRIPPGGLHRIPYSRDVYAEDTTDGQAWWCVERHQSTAWGELYRYNGSLLPRPLYNLVRNRSDVNDNDVEDHRDYVEDALQTQHNIWDNERDNPIVLVGRARSLVRFTEDQPFTRIIVEALNLGQRAGTARVTELVPPGYTVSSIDPPARVSVDPDGTTRLEWQVALDGAVPNPGFATLYDQADLAYTLSRGTADCEGRCEGDGVIADWADTAGRPWRSFSEPLVIEICEE